MTSIDASPEPEVTVGDPLASPPVSFESRPTMGDYLVTAASAMRSSMLTIAIGTFATVTSAFSIILAGDLMSIIFLIGGLSLLTGLFIVPIMWWSVRQRRDLMLAPTMVTADERGITLISTTSRAEHAWSVFRKVNETSRAFLFDTGTNVAIMVTKDGVAADVLASFRSLLGRVGILSPAPPMSQRLRPLLGVPIGLAAAAVIILAPAVLGGP